MLCVSHINLVYLFIAVIITLTTIQNAYSEAWIVEPGKYKYTASLMAIDKYSHRKKKLYRQQEQDLLQQEYDLMQEKDSLGAANPNSKEMIQINEELAVINARKERITRIKDHSNSKLEIEYGLKEANSVGAVIGYDVSKFNQQCNRGNSAEIYLKHSLWQNGEYVITMIPRFSFLNYNMYYNKTLIGNGLFVGRSTFKEDKGSSYREVGLNIAKTINKTPYKDTHITFSFQEGYKHPSGISIANYVEFDYVRNKKQDSEFNFFEQISVAKTFNIANFGENDLTLQLGYFWKGSLKDDFSTISGPTISLWFTI